MNVYDFDKTIYNGDSTIDYYFFCVRRKPILLRYLFRQGLGLVLYFLGVFDKTKFKEWFYCFFHGLSDPERNLCAFWDIHIRKIKPWYIRQMRDDDVIISASPEFLIKEAVQRLGEMTVIGSVVDSHTGRYTGENCFGEEKVRRLFERIPEAVVDSFYSDSYSDAPMARVAQECYLVKGEKICSINWR